MLNKQNYLKDLIYYTTVNRISIYDYFYNLSECYKSNDLSKIESFELENPFLNKIDLVKLLNSKDERISTFFANSMTNVIKLNLEASKKKEQKQTEKSKQEKYLEELDKFLKTHNLTTSEYFEILGNTYLAGKENYIPDFEKENPFLTKADIEKLVNSNDSNINYYFTSAMTRVIELNREKQKVTDQEVIIEKESEIKPKENSKEEELLSRESQEEVIEDALKDVDEKELDRKDIEQEINEALESTKEETIKREDQEELIEEALRNLREEDTIGKDSIKEVIEESLESTKEETISRENQEELIEEAFNNLENTETQEVNINTKLLEKLDGFAVIKEPLTKKTTAYSYDSKDKQTLKNGTILEENDLTLESGYYVNINEYLNLLMTSITEDFETATNLTITKDNQTLTYNEFTEEVFKEIMNSNFIYFGSEFQKDFENFQDLEATYKEETSNYYDLKLKRGLFIRKDLIETIMSNYKLKVLLPKNTSKEIETYTSYR